MVSLLEKKSSSSFEVCLAVSIWLAESSKTWPVLPQTATRAAVISANLGMKDETVTVHEKAKEIHLAISRESSFLNYRK